MKKLFAVLLAVWLPLFSGSALAASVSMQAMGDDCQAATHMSEHLSHPQLPHHPSAASHHDQLAADHDHAIGQHDQHDSTCNTCGVCHIACSGFLATVTFKAMETLLLTQNYTPFSTQFQSITSAPLTPPPLSLA